VNEETLFYCDRCGEICMSRSMRGVWKRSDGTAIEALPDERGVHGYIPRHISTDGRSPGRVLGGGHPRRGMSAIGCGPTVIYTSKMSHLHWHRGLPLYLKLAVSLDESVFSSLVIGSTTASGCWARRYRSFSLLCSGKFYSPFSTSTPAGKVYGVAASRFP
jgi:hypothetical protein